MAYESYADRLERINKLTIRMEELDITRKELADLTGISSRRIRDIQRGSVIEEWEGRILCEHLHRRWNKLWVLYEGEWVARLRER